MLIYCDFGMGWEDMDGSDGMAWHSIAGFDTPFI